MKVILTKDVTNLGRVGDVKEVSDGYARNFLLTKHLALPATSEVLAKVQKEQAEHQQKISKEHERFLQIRHKLENKTVTIRAKAQKNNLFAAIHEKEISQAIAEKIGVELSPQYIQIPKPVKSLGAHDVTIRLAKNLEAHVHLQVVADNNGQE